MTWSLLSPSCHPTALSRGVQTREHLWQSHHGKQGSLLSPTNSKSPSPSSQPSLSSCWSHLDKQSFQSQKVPLELAPDCSDPGAGRLPTRPPHQFGPCFSSIPFWDNGGILKPVPTWAPSQPKAEAGPARSDPGPSCHHLTSVCPIYPTRGLELPLDAEAKINRK